MKQTNLTIAEDDRRVILGIASQNLAEKVTSALRSLSRPMQLSVCEDVPKLRSSLERDSATAVVLDEALLGSTPLDEALLQLTEACPVIVLAPPWRQAEFSSWIAQGDVEFVSKVGDFVALVAAFIARRLRWAELADSAIGLPWRELPPDFASILRHEINNPLTGILGNAELLLSNLREKIPPGALQRLETVVDLAVRLRETTRRLSNAWERDHAHARTA